MAAEAELTPTSYIQHHLKNLTHSVGEGSFWTLNVDTFVTALLMGLLMVVLFWLATRKATAGVPGKWQAFVEICLEFVDRQARDTYHGTSKLVTPIAITLFFWILLMNLLKMIPADFIAKPLELLGVGYWKPVPTADVNATLGLSISVLLVCLFYNVKIKGIGGWSHELVTAPFGTSKNPVMAVLLGIVNFAMQIIEFASKTLSHGLRLFGNMYAGELIFMLIALMGGAFALTGTGIGLAIGHVIAGLAWAIFHILIIILQAFIFMMLALVYIGQAHDHH